jgi:molecular chaperone GrpE
VLEQHGVVTYGQIGDRFETAIHEPVESVPVDSDDEKNTIVAVVQKGYKMGEKIVRAAKVKVGE